MGIGFIKNLGGGSKETNLGVLYADGILTPLGNKLAVGNVTKSKTSYRTSSDVSSATTTMATFSKALNLKVTYKTYTHAWEDAEVYGNTYVKMNNLTLQEHMSSVADARNGNYTFENTSTLVLYQSLPAYIYDSAGVYNYFEIISIESV